jgi:hypothetical protein
LAIDSVEDAEALAGVARAAADAGVHGLELPVGAGDFLSLDTPPADCHGLAIGSPMPVSYFGWALLRAADDHIWRHGPLIAGPMGVIARSIVPRG